MAVLLQDLLNEISNVVAFAWIWHDVLQPVVEKWKTVRDRTGNCFGSGGQADRPDQGQSNKTCSTKKARAKRHNLRTTYVYDASLQLATSADRAGHRMMTKRVEQLIVEPPPQLALSAATTERKGFIVLSLLTFHSIYINNTSKHKA